MSRKVTDCDIVLELLPLYIEQKIGAESNEFVQKHLESCKKCQEVYAFMNADLLSERKEVTSKMPGVPVSSAESDSKISCSVIQDLLISYCDGLTAENVGELIQAHLAECTVCHNHHEEMIRQRESEEQKELSRGRKFGRKLASLRYYMLGGIIGFAAPIVLLVLWYLLASVRSYFEIMFYSYFL